MKLTRATKAPTTEPCPECAARAAAEAEAPPRFSAYELAGAFARTAGLYGDGTDVVRRDHYDRYVPVDKREFRHLLAEFARGQGWDTTHPFGRLDVLEAAARDTITTMYRRPADPAPAADGPLAPPSSWARRGREDALPEPWDVTGLAQVFAREHAYVCDGRALIYCSGQLMAWNGASWETWGTFEPTHTIVTGADDSMDAVGRNLHDMLTSFVAGGRYWDETGQLLPVGGVHPRLLDAVVDLLAVGDALPGGPAAVAALDRARAGTSTTSTRLVDPRPAYLTEGL
ncbi:hypothetical protein MYK68_18580 [Gordonia sp. PP30]|uniref:hypothetical protein n=1 Tax=Gordonia sp. PP30 TaxID=2935861 RepID=UPI001FFF6B81|nr:hypothetical protein [Gordonia sp. PP30]UQE74691.1 hypothetical protein MYK68_18580 [Gordonia sp. PP30]